MSDDTTFTLSQPATRKNGLPSRRGRVGGSRDMARFELRRKRGSHTDEPVVMYKLIVDGKVMAKHTSKLSCERMGRDYYAGRNVKVAL